MCVCMSVCMGSIQINLYIKSTSQVTFKNLPLIVALYSKIYYLFKQFLFLDISVVSRFSTSLCINPCPYL